MIYLGELHPFKQYSGSKARFLCGEEEKVLECYTHHISDFTRAAGKSGLQLVALEEFFDENNRQNAPRILSLLFRKVADGNL